MLLIDLKGLPAGREIASVRSRVHEVTPGGTDGGYTHDGTANVNEAFWTRESIGVYLPPNVKAFAIVVDAFDGPEGQGCRILTGEGSFVVGQPTLTLMLQAPTDETCARTVVDADAETNTDSDGDGDGDGDARDALADAGPDTSDDPATPAECGADTTVVSCFDPTDAGGGSPDPFMTATPNPECDSYCTDVVNNCPGIFTDADGCRAVCTEAGWHLRVDGGVGQIVLTCLADDAHRAGSDVFFKTQACDGADPSLGSCDPACQTYCVLRRRLCNDTSLTDVDCVSACASLSNTRSRVVPCLVQILEHDVPGDRRYCSLTDLNGTCGRCAAL